MAENRKPDQVESRVARLETEVSNVANAVDNLAKQFARMADRQAMSGKTNWSVVFGGVGLILTIMTPILTGILWQTFRVDAAWQKHADLPGHTEAMVKHGQHVERFDRAFHAIEANQEAVGFLDVNLQREMRDLNARQDGETKALDLRLQNEMRLMGESRVVRLKEAERRLAKTEAWQDAHDKRVVGLNAAQSERIKALERIAWRGADTRSASPGRGSE